MLPENHCFHSGERLILFQIGPFIQVEETRVSLKEIHRYYMQEHLEYSFPVSIELVSECNASCN
jgi:hypothetical protein